VYAVRQALSECQNSVSLSPEGLDRVDPGSAPGGHKAGSAGDSENGYENQGQSEWVSGFDSEKPTADQTREGERRSDANQQAIGREAHTL
jgi:hypothetical protein